MATESGSSANGVTLIHSPRDAWRAAFDLRAAGRKVGLVPTMGALHRGHLSLVEASLAECDDTFVSIFVNPTQFGPGEDLDEYPRTLERDTEQLAGLGRVSVFAPSAAAMYPEGFDTYVTVGAEAEPLEGAARPVHFRGVATVVMKLFQIVPADIAFFGQKDYQQTLVVRRMAADLNVPTEVRVCPTVREADGLAMSSRNAYLSADERTRATSIWGALRLAERLHAEGEREVGVVRDRMMRLLGEAGVDTVEYIAFVAEGTVRPVERLDGPTVVAIAARVGATRLIDNHRVE